jgi:hypothetical protein
VKPRPHEETWTVRWEEDYGAAYVETSCKDDTICVDDPTRAALIAAAPAMARMLLRGMEVTAAYDQNYETCLAGCGGHGAEATHHADDCDLVALLRAAGVLP